MVPIVFDQCAGWLHPAPGLRGVVICGSIGFESLCSHKSLAILAERIAAAGQPVLRFDYRGCGDSADIEGDCGRRAIWKDNIRAAVAFLRTRTGVDKIALAGLRLGATLATEVAAEMSGVERLALIAPPTTGKAYVRELKALSRLIGCSDEELEPGALCVAGYRLSPAEIADLQAPDCTALTAIPAPLVLGLCREAPANHPWLARLRALGGEVTAEVFDGYDALMCDPTASQVPHAALERIANWIVEGAASRDAAPLDMPPARIQGSDFTENAVLFGGAGKLAGVYCSPRDEAPGQALILVNAGAIHHVGWARGHVEMARGLAAQGIASLRLDLGGIGDSFAAASGPSGSLYAPELKDDIRAAVDWLEARGVVDIGVLGACSGAYQALQAAVADARIGRLVLVNQLCFVWGASYSLQLSAWQATKSAIVGAAMAREQQNAGEAARALNRLMPLAKTVAKGSFGAFTNLMALAQTGFSRVNVVEDWFETLSARGAHVRMLYSDADPGLVELERWLGPDGARATALPGVDKFILARADHMLTPQRARAALADHVLDLYGVARAGVHAIAAA